MRLPNNERILGLISVSMSIRRKLADHKLVNEYMNKISTISRTLLNGFLLLSLALLGACSSGSSSETTTTNIQGKAVKGVISNGIVHAYYTPNSGETIHLASVRTNSLGQFSFDPKQLSNDGNGVVLLELSSDANTRITCDMLPGCTQPQNGNFYAFGDAMPAPDDFKMLGAFSANGSTSKQSAAISPLSHIILSTAIASPQGLSQASIDSAATWLKDDLNLAFDPLSTTLSDLTEASELTQLSQNELMQAIYGAALFDASMSSEWSAYRLTLDNLDIRQLANDAAALSNDLKNWYVNESSTLTAKLSTAANYSQQQADEINAQELTILSHPQSVTVIAGADVNLRVSASSNQAISYQWYHNGQAISGAQTSQLSLNAVSNAQAGSYYAEVRAGERTEESLRALVTVQEPSEPPSITRQPQPQTLSSGQTLSLSVTAVGSGQLSYHWQKDGSLIPGATQSSYTINSVSTSDAGNYRVTVSNLYGASASQFASVVVTTPLEPVRILSQPQDVSVTEGEAAQFSVSATGSGFLSYQWRKDGNPIAGATSSQLTISNVQTSDRGVYDVVVQNSQGPVTSAQAQLSVAAQIVPIVIQQQPQTQTINVGATASFSISASGGNGALRYQWYRDGQAISGANSPTYQVSNVQSSDAGSYSASVTDGLSTNNSLSALLTVNPLSALRLTWDIPNEREDGSLLDVSEIASYQIEYGYDSTRLDRRVTVSGGNSVSYTLSNLSSGRLYLRIATTDTDGLTGQFSGLIEADIP